MKNDFRVFLHLCPFCITQSMYDWELSLSNYHQAPPSISLGGQFTYDPLHHVKSFALKIGLSDIPDMITDTGMDIRDIRDIRDVRDVRTMRTTSLRTFVEDTIISKGRLSTGCSPSTSMNTHYLFERFRYPKREIKICDYNQILIPIHLDLRKSCSIVIELHIQDQSVTMSLCGKTMLLETPGPQYVIGHYDEIPDNNWQGIGYILFILHGKEWVPDDKDQIIYNNCQVTFQMLDGYQLSGKFRTALDDASEQLHMQGLENHDRMWVCTTYIFRIW
jgi:hypothetical protein